VSVYYGRSVYRYFSKIREGVSFDTEQQARDYDRTESLKLVAELTSFDAAAPVHVLALRFLAEEIECLVRAGAQMEKA
jgi:hypothetical protein